jgi:hypothetical protein
MERVAIAKVGMATRIFSRASAADRNRPLSTHASTIKR